MSEKQRYSTIDDVIAYAVEPYCGEYSSDYDLYAIADELFDFTADIDEDGVQHGNAYFIERDDVDWEEVYAKHDHGVQLDEMVNAAWDGRGKYIITDMDKYVTEVLCDKESELKGEVRDIIDGDWDKKIVIAKTDRDENEMTEGERMEHLKRFFDENHKKAQLLRKNRPEE